MSYLPTNHHTFVHHISLDPSGFLLASCSSDKTVEVFYRRHVPGDEDVWELGCTLRDHTGPVLHLGWCQHREHGPLLATVGADRWIYVYRIIMSSREGRTVIQSVRWSPVRGYEKDAITDVAFIPPQQYHVLLLSTASLDGCVRLYEVQQPLQFPCIYKITPEEDDNGLLPKDDCGGETPFSVQYQHGSSSGGGGGVVSACDYARIGSSVGTASPKSQPSSPSGLITDCVSSRNAANGASGGSGTGITSLSWFPGAAEPSMTLAVGSISGRFFLYRYAKESNTFCRIPVPANVVCRSAIEDVEWAPAVGRRFNLLAICSRTEVFILRLNCISPALCPEGNMEFEVFHCPLGAVSASWSKSATLLYLAMDNESGTLSVLQLSDPLDHQSWQLVSEQGVT